MKVLIIDMGSRLNTLGGEAVIARVLYMKLKDKHDTFYLGYDVAYSKKDKNAIVLPRGKNLGSGLRNSFVSEIGAFRALYYLVFVRKLRSIGIDKALLAQKIADVRPDLIIANSVQDYPLLKYLKRKGLQFKSIYIDHGSLSTANTKGYFTKEGMPLTIGTGINSTSLKSAKKAFFNFFDMNVALNKWHLRAIREFTNKVEYIPNGIDVKIWRQPALEKRVKENYNISRNDTVVLYVGRLFERQKNLSVLIRAFKQIEGINIKLLLVGAGPSLESYRIIADGDNRIHFAGPKSGNELNSIYNISSLFILPSNWEGFPITMIEAAAHSIPIILSKNAYIDDLKRKDLGDIVSFDTKSPQDLKRKILLVLKNKKVRTRSIKSSRNIVRLFREENMIAAYRDLLSVMNAS